MTITPDELSKWIAALTGGVGLLYALIKFVYQPFRAAWKAREDAINQLQEDLEQLRADRDKESERYNKLIQVSELSEASIRSTLDGTKKQYDRTIAELETQKEALRKDVLALRDRNFQADQLRQELTEKLDLLTDELAAEKATREEREQSHEAELTKLNDATTKQLAQMRELLQNSQIQINSLSSLYNAVKQDLDANKSLALMLESKNRECQSTVELITGWLDHARAFVSELGLSTVQVTAIFEGELGVAEVRAPIVAKLTRKGTGPLPPLPEGLPK